MYIFGFAGDIVTSKAFSHQKAKHLSNDKGDDFKPFMNIFTC